MAKLEWVRGNNGKIDWGFVIFLVIALMVVFSPVEFILIVWIIDPSAEFGPITIPYLPPMIR